MKNQTSWGKVAKWYDDLLEKGSDTYQEQLIKPNLLRILAMPAHQPAVLKHLGAEMLDKAVERVPFAGQQVPRQLNFVFLIH